MRGALSLLVLALLLPSGAAFAGETWQGRTAAFFGITFLDTSHEGELHGIREDEQARVALVEDFVRDRLQAEGLDLVDLDPVAEELARTVNLASCNGCELRMADQLGAEYAVVGEVQKVSNLILSMNLYIRDVETGRPVEGLAVDIRGNNDDSWLRGMRYILDRAIFAEG
jgi:hypothetical protein